MVEDKDILKQLTSMDMRLILLGRSEMSKKQTEPYWLNNTITKMGKIDEKDTHNEWNKLKRRAKMASISCGSIRAQVKFLNKITQGRFLLYF